MRYNPRSVANSKGYDSNINRGVPIQALKDSPGHSSIMTTQKYLHANPDVFSGDTLELQIKPMISMIYGQIK